MDQVELEDMFRAFGYDERDSIVHYHNPRRTYDEAVADQADVLSVEGVFSAAVERRSVPAGNVTFVTDEPPAQAPEPVKEAEKEAAPGGAKD